MNNNIGISSLGLFSGPAWNAFQQENARLNGAASSDPLFTAAAAAVAKAQRQKKFQVTGMPQNYAQAHRDAQDALDKWYANHQAQQQQQKQQQKQQP